LAPARGRSHQQYFLDGRQSAIGCQNPTLGRCWDSVAAIPARDWALTAEPSIEAVAVGIAFHQWAAFS